MAKLLVIDTSERVASLEAWDGDVCVAASEFGCARHAQSLTGHIRQLLVRVQWIPTEIDAIAVNIGPGSFTGIRVGLATAKGMAYVGGQELIGVDAFDAWAAGLSASVVGPVAVLMEGQLETVDLTVYHRRDDEWRRNETRTIPQYQLAVLKDFAAAIGPSESLKKIISNEFRWLDIKRRTDIVARRRISAGRFDNAMSLEPYYVRPSSAEEKWAARIATA